MKNGMSMYGMTENGELQLLSEECFDFSRGELMQSKIIELKNFLNRYAFTGG